MKVYYYIAIMRMYLIILAFTISLATFAQVRDISVQAGVNVPMYKDIESDAVIAVNYGQFYHTGLGFRAGAQWSPSVANINNFFGVPVSFAYRTKARTFRKRLQSGAIGAMYESAYGDAGDMARNLAGGFLLNLFSDMEFFIGVTPGYVSGVSSSHSKTTIWGNSWQYREETWSEKKNNFSISIDAGMCLNYNIWRFDIKVMPAFHYGLTTNYISQKLTEEESVGMKKYSKPLHWFFTFCGGIAYRFKGN